MCRWSCHSRTGIARKITQAVPDSLGPGKERKNRSGYGKWFKKMVRQTTRRAAERDARPPWSRSEKTPGLRENQMLPNSNPMKLRIRANSLLLRFDQTESGRNPMKTPQRKTQKIEQDMKHTNSKPGQRVDYLIQLSHFRAPNLGAHQFMGTETTPKREAQKTRTRSRPARDRPRHAAKNLRWSFAGTATNHIAPVAWGTARRRPA